MKGDPRAYTGRSGDTNLRHVKDLPKGYSLWRCTNGGGTPYSMVVDPHGCEVQSTETVRESSMLCRFISDVDLWG